MEGDNYFEGLWQALYHERRSNELQVLPKTFYEDIIESIKAASNQQKSQNFDDKEEKEKMQKLLTELFEIRKRKILIYVAHSKPLPQPSIPSEEAFFESVLELFNKEVLNFDGNLQTPSSKNLLSVIKDIPEILLPSGKKIGPLKKGDKLDIDDDTDLEFLKSMMICEP